MRYQENNPVKVVLEWLRKQNCQITIRGYDQFLRRVLRLMPIKQAHELGVDVDLLRAIRIRYRLPVDPKGVRVALGKRRPAHHARARRRRIAPRPKERPQPLEPRLARRPVMAVVGTATTERSPIAAAAPPVQKLRGTMDNPHNNDWMLINEMARQKLYDQDKRVMINDVGLVIHMSTRHEYTVKELVEQFGLHENEAESCFMTFTERKKW